MPTDTAANQKAAIRAQLRDERRNHVETLPGITRGLLFRHPPSPILDRIAGDTIIGLYHATPFEAPAAGYAQFFHERGHPITLPRFTSRSSEMEFAALADPFSQSDLETGPFGLAQPSGEAETLVPAILFVPLLGFTVRCERIGQGGGHYDKWLAANEDTAAFGIAWDCQLAENLPLEPHDRTLDAVITPTRLYEAS